MFKKGINVIKMPLHRLRSTITIRIHLTFFLSLFKEIIQLKKIIINTLDSNKALDIVSIDLENKSSIADYLIIASGTSSRHIQWLSEIVLEKFKSNGITNCKIEGNESNDWKLIDGIDVIVHIFNPEKRKFYELEKMWSESIPKEKILIWKLLQYF